jgi:2-oxopent-4-enoate/cis-2-oxohex-4-enoate hydratase
LGASIVDERGIALDHALSALTRGEHRRLAEILFRAARDRSTVRPLTLVYPEMTIRDAADVRDMTLTLRLAAGEQVVGAKVVVLGDRHLAWFTTGMVQTSGLVDRASLTRPIAEAKLALSFDESRKTPPESIDDLLASPVTVLPCIEVTDSRYDRGAVEPRDTVADNGAAAILVIGEEPLLNERLPSPSADALLWLARRVIESRGRIEQGLILVGPSVGRQAPLATDGHVYPSHVSQTLSEAER